MTASATERESTMTVDGLELFVRERGTGTPILMLNGLGSNADMWGAVEDELSMIGRTIVFDMPGSGRSPTPRAPLSISDHAALALALLDELGHERADVVGFSLGGMVAQQLAHDAGDRVRRLTLGRHGVRSRRDATDAPGADAPLDAASLPLRARIPRDEPAAHGGRPYAARPPFIAERIATSSPAAVTRLCLPTRGWLHVVEPLVARHGACPDTRSRRVGRPESYLRPTGTSLPDCCRQAGCTSSMAATCALRS